jgi:HPt (histidine-containing phosphotransfer) domain-containing protein
MSQELANAWVANQQAAIDHFFMGNHALYMAFKTACLGQFPRDVQAIESALQSRDDEALRRAAHNLKGALNMLGCKSQAHAALQLELAACAGEAQAIELAKHRLLADLQDFLTRPD